MAAATDRFYADLPVAGGFADVFDASLFREVPTDWHVVITDVHNSTQAIERAITAKSTWSARRASSPH